MLPPIPGLTLPHERIALVLLLVCLIANLKRKTPQIESTNQSCLFEYSYLDDVGFVDGIVVLHLVKGEVVNQRIHLLALGNGLAEELGDLGDDLGEVGLHLLVGDEADVVPVPLLVVGADVLKEGRVVAANVVEERVGKTLKGAEVALKDLEVVEEGAQRISGVPGHIDDLKRDKRK